MRTTNTLYLPPALSRRRGLPRDRNLRRSVGTHPPSSRLALAGANLLVNISASDEMVGKHSYLCSLIEQQSARTISAYLYCSAGCGESSTDLVFAGNGLIVENGTILQTNDRFSFDEQITICDVDIEK